jgi:hypothetical protein
VQNRGEFPRRCFPGGPSSKRSVRQRLAQSTESRTTSPDSAARPKNSTNRSTASQRDNRNRQTDPKAVDGHVTPSTTSAGYECLMVFVGDREEKTEGRRSAASHCQVKTRSTATVQPGTAGSALTCWPRLKLSARSGESLRYFKITSLTGSTSQTTNVPASK